MAFRTTWVVLLLVVILAAGIWWFELRDSGEPTGRQGALVPFACDSLTSVEVQHSGVRFRLARRGEGWVMLSPVEAPCDPQVIDRLCTVLDEARVDQNIGKGEEERYGLQVPTSIMTLHTRDGQKLSLQFGRINPLQTLVYVKRGVSSDVLLTTSELLTLSLNTDFGWRDKRIIDVPPESVQRIRIRTIVAGSLVVERHDDSVWRVVGDVAWRVDPVRMSNLLYMLAQMKAIGVSAEAKLNLENYGLDNRRLSAVLEDAAGNVLGDAVLGFAKGEGANYVIVPDKPEIFRVGGDLGAVLSGFAADCRDRKVFPPFDPREVSRIEVDSASDAFAVERRSVTRWGVDYSAHNDSTFVVDPQRVEETLEVLRSLQIDEFPASQPDPRYFEPAEMTVKLLGEDGLLSAVQVGRKQPDGFLTFVHGLDEPAVFLVSPGKLIELPFDLSRLGYEQVEILDEGP
jgi:hypothetical protein